MAYSEQLHELLDHNGRRILAAAMGAIAAITLVACDSGGEVSATAPPSAVAPAVPGTNPESAAPTTEAPAPVTAAPTPAKPLLGYDVSFPQCNPDGKTATLPATPGAFAIVGVNGMRPSDVNTCFADEFRWAGQSTGGTSQPKAAIYATISNPGTVKDTIPNWPKSGSNPYGDCNGDNTAACAYEFGVARAKQDEHTIAPTSLNGLTEVIDVERDYSWDTDDVQKNRAAVEGIAGYFLDHGGRVIIYSTPDEIHEELGAIPASSNLSRLPVWLAGAHSVEEALAACAMPSFTKGQVVLAQILGGRVDQDITCQ